MIEEPKIDRNLALGLLRVTEAGALAAAPLQGRGNKEAADKRAVEAIRESLASVDMKGTVVIGEGEKDEAPMLFFGEEIGNGLGPEVDVAVDPIEGTSLTASGLPGAISVVALAERGTMLTTHVHYMDKLVVGRKARGVIDLEMPVEWNLRRIAKAEGLPVQELTVVVLKRDRVLCIDDLCSGKDVFFAATGITTGELLKGVRYEDVYAYTQSMVLRSTSGTMRIVDAYHPIDKLRVKGLLPEQVRVR